jgi:hypothetical protein
MGAQMNFLSIVQPATAAAIAIAAMSIVTIPETLAQQPNSHQSGPVRAVTGFDQEITLTMGMGGLFQTSEPYAKISVTDGKIVEATPQSDREFVFNPKGIGSTNVFVFNEKNMLIGRLNIVVVGKAQEVREHREALGTVRIYNRIHDAHGALARPALYQCNNANCETPSEAPNALPSPNVAPTTSPKVGATTDNEDAQ